MVDASRGAACNRRSSALTDGKSQQIIAIPEGNQMSHSKLTARQANDARR
jgi:hypothetical protein